MPDSADSRSSAASFDVPSLSTAASSTSSTAAPPAFADITAPPPVRDQPQPLSPGITGFSFPEFSDTSAVRPSAVDSFRDACDQDDRPTMNRDHDDDQAARDERDRQDGNRKRSRWYDDQFAVKGPESTVAERVSKDAPIIAELRTNVIVKDEYTLVTDLSSFLSERFARPETAIMVTIAHSACLMFGGTFEPAYFLTISTLPQYVQPVTNKRNAALTQSFMVEVLGVPAERGIVHFKAIAEDSLAHCGKTIMAQIEHEEDPLGLNRRLTNRSRRKSLLSEKRKSIRSDIQRQPSEKSTKNTKNLQVSGPASPPLPSPTANGESVVKDSSPPNSAPHPGGLSASGPSPNARPVSAKKSILKMTGQEQDGLGPLPPSFKSHDAPGQKISKRKSLIAIFKR